MLLNGIVKINFIFKPFSKAKMKSNKIIYSLNLADIQTVAKETLNRKLSDVEVESILDSIAEKIHWYEAIQYSIIENIKVSVEE